MATTGYTSTGAYLDTGYGIARIHADIVYTVTRTNNTVYFTNTYTRIKYVRESGGWTSFNYPSGWTMRLYVPSSTQRTSNTGSGSRSVNQVNDGTKVSFSVGVGANDNTMAARVGAWFAGDSQTYANKTLNIPTTTAPSGTTTVDSSTITNTSISVRNNVTNWGNNVTSGSVRSYIADNSSWSGQTYKSTTDNALVAHTGLTPNTRYWFRGWADNGGGKSAYQSSDNAVTKSAVYDGGVIEVSSTTYSATGARVYQGYYATSSKLQYRVKGDATWSDSDSQAGDNIDLIITGLLPNTIYERRFVTTTTAGTFEGPVIEFTTFPAAKIINSDGTVQNAIPRLINEDSTTTMVDINIIEPSA